VKSIGYEKHGDKKLLSTYKDKRLLGFLIGLCTIILKKLTKKQTFLLKTM